jgi:hypothetical protein
VVSYFPFFNGGVTEGRKRGVTEGRKRGVTEGRKRGVTEGRKDKRGGNAISLVLNYTTFSFRPERIQMFLNAGVSMDDLNDIM